MDESLKILERYHDVRIDEIPSEGPIRNAYNKILYETKEDPIGLIDLIKDQYRPVDIIPGTIGSYLFGGIQKSYGDVPMECSPLHYYGIKNSDFDSCTSNVWIQKSEQGDNRFVQIMKYPNSINSYVFISDSFVGFTKRELKTISKSGTSKLATYKTSRSQHYISSKITPIDEIKYRQPEKQAEKKLEAVFYDVISEIIGDNRNTFLIGVSIVLLTIILGLIASVTFSNNPYKNRHL